MIDTLYKANAGRVFTFLYGLMAAFCLLSVTNINAQDVSADKTVKVQAVSGLKYDIPRFVATPGSTIRILLENVDEMPHNLLIVEPGTRRDVVDQAEAMGEKGLENSYRPDSPNVLAGIPLLDPDERASIIFQVPAQKGIYPYVCTYPSHGIVMYGAMYVTDNPDDLPPLDKDPHIPAIHKEQTSDASMTTDSPHPYPMEMPQVSRLFMPDASPAAIAVGMEDNQSYCWDAGVCYLRYAWEGGYIDASKQWDAKAREVAAIEGNIYVRNKTGFPFRVGRMDSIPEPEFKGYSLINGYPQFTYNIGEITVREFIQPAENGSGLKIRYRLNNINKFLWYAKFGGGNVGIKASTGSWEGDYLKLSPVQAKEFMITIISK